MVTAKRKKKRAKAAQRAPAVGLLKAGELARHTGLTRQAIHQYVLMGLLHPVDQTEGKQRLFDPSAVRRVAVIRGLCANNYTLQAVRDIFLKGR